jgi:alkanesulfonate monooxygenase SsuD/methylene tetrahydromethanopterin reductase-like flavin-dependent oxidoreductase (luciferase family)
VDVGLYIKDFVDSRDLPLHQQIEDAAEVARRARSLGFMGIYAPQHWVAYPTVWLEPIPLLARLAPETDGLKLITGIILLPMHNPVHLAEQVISIDHISNGRFVLGVGLGYRQTELEATGTNRQERVGRFEESLKLMKLLWSGDEVSFEGRFWQVHNARVSVTPLQAPHPPIWIASQSRRATRRAARIGDACLLGPQQDWKDVGQLAAVYREALEEYGKASSGLLGANRSIAIARDRKTALREARAAAESKAGMYGGWDMQERRSVNLGLSGHRDLTDWAIVGTPQECAEQITRSYHQDGLRYVGLGFLNLPRAHAARLEYLQLISEELLPLLPRDGK